MLAIFILLPFCQSLIMVDVNYVLGKNKRRKTKEAENRPDVIRLMQNEIIKVESKLKD